MEIRQLQRQGGREREEGEKRGGVAEVVVVNGAILSY